MTSLQAQLIFEFYAIFVIVFGPPTIYLLCTQIAWMLPKNWLENSESSDPAKKALALSQALLIVGWLAFGYFLWDLLSFHDYSPWSVASGPARAAAIVGAIFVVGGLAAKTYALRASKKLDFSALTLILGAALFVLLFLFVPTPLLSSEAQPYGWGLLFDVLVLNVSFAWHNATLAAQKTGGRAGFFILSMILSPAITWLFVAKKRSVNKFLA